MKAKIVKAISALSIAAMMSFSSLAAQAAEITDESPTNYTDICDTANWGIEDYANNLRSIYKDAYPEAAEAIDEIIDDYLNDNGFVMNYAEKGASVFLAVESDIHTTLEPEAVPTTHEAGTYFSGNFIPLIKQKTGYNDGAAAAVLMALYGCGYYDYFTDRSSADSQQNALVNEITWNSNKASIGEVTRILRRYIGKRYSHIYQTKYVTNYNEMMNLLITGLSMDTSPIIRIPNGTNGYYYGVVDSIEDGEESEGIRIIDPRSGTYQDFTPEEFHDLFFSGDRNNKDRDNHVWMSVYAYDNNTRSQIIEAVKKEYPSNYFTKTKGECTDHNIKKPEWSSTCKYYDDGYQCAAFARYVFHEVIGATYTLTRGSNITGFGSQLVDPIIRDDGSFSGIPLTRNIAQEKLQDLSTGTYIRVRTSEDIDHSLAVLSTSDTGIEVYQANYGGNCIIEISFYTWDKFVAEFPHLYFYVD